MIKELQEKVQVYTGDRDKGISRHEFITMLIGEIGDTARAILTDDKIALKEQLALIVLETCAMANKFNIDLEPLIRKELGE